MIVSLLGGRMLWNTLLPSPFLDYVSCVCFTMSGHVPSDCPGGSCGQRIPKPHLFDGFRDLLAEEISVIPHSKLPVSFSNLHSCYGLEMIWICHPYIHKLKPWSLWQCYKMLGSLRGGEQWKVVLPSQALWRSKSSPSLASLASSYAK